MYVFVCIGIFGVCRVIIWDYEEWKCSAFCAEYWIQRRSAAANQWWEKSKLASFRQRKVISIMAQKGGVLFVPAKLWPKFPGLFRRSVIRFRVLATLRTGDISWNWTTVVPLSSEIANTFPMKLFSIASIFCAARPSLRPLRIQPLLR